MNNRTLEEMKIKFIQDHIPNYRSIQPFLDRTTVDEIKRLMHDNGLIRTNYRSITDNAIINLILIAQGKKRFSVRASKKIDRIN